MKRKYWGRDEERFWKERAKNFPKTVDREDPFLSFVQKYHPSSFVRIVDIGAGAGRYSKYFLESGSLFICAVEPSKAMAEQCIKNLEKYIARKRFKIIIKAWEDVTHEEVTKHYFDVALGVRTPPMQVESCLDKALSLVKDGVFLKTTIERRDELFAAFCGRLGVTDTRSPSSALDFYERFAEKRNLRLHRQIVQERRKKEKPYGASLSRYLRWLKDANSLVCSEEQAKQVLLALEADGYTYTVTQSSLCLYLEK